VEKEDRGSRRKSYSQVILQFLQSGSPAVMLGFLRMARTIIALLLAVLNRRDEFRVALFVNDERVAGAMHASIRVGCAVILHDLEQIRPFPF